MITNNMKLRNANKLDRYGEYLANKTFKHFIKDDNDDFFDGDETEDLTRGFLFHLDKLMGNE